MHERYDYKDDVEILKIVYEREDKGWVPARVSTVFWGKVGPLDDGILFNLFGLNCSEEGNIDKNKEVVVTFTQRGSTIR